MDIPLAHARAYAAKIVRALHAADPKARPPRLRGRRLLRLPPPVVYGCGPAPRRPARLGRFCRRRRRNLRHTLPGGRGRKAASVIRRVTTRRTPRMRRERK